MQQRTSVDIQMQPACLKICGDVWRVHRDDVYASVLHGLCLGPQGIGGGVAAIGDDTELHVRLVVHHTVGHDTLHHLWPLMGDGCSWADVDDEADEVLQLHFGLSGSQIYPDATDSKI
jgi:hypothetical protein